MKKSRKPQSRRAQMLAELTDLKTQNDRFKSLLIEAHNHLLSALGAAAKRQVIARIRNELQWV